MNSKQLKIMSINMKLLALGYNLNEYKDLPEMDEMELDALEDCLTAEAEDAGIGA